MCSARAAVVPVADGTAAAATKHSFETLIYCVEHVLITTTTASKQGKSCRTKLLANFRRS